MRRRLPSPALVIACIALFVALGGAGFAASLALVKSSSPVMLVAGGVGTNGKVTGARVTGGRVSAGVDVITIRGDSFSRATALWPHMHAVVSPTITISGKGVTTIPPSCAVASEAIAPNGGGKVEVHCFAYDPASGWQPADTPFDFQILGPGR